MCSTNSFKFTWSRGYICNSSYYHYQIESINFSHACHIFPRRMCLGWLSNGILSVASYRSRESWGSIATVQPMMCANDWVHNGPLARYVKLRAAHAPGMLGTFSPPLRVSDPDMHHGTCVMYVPWFISGSLTSGFRWSRWRGERSRHSWRMRNPQFYVSGKWSMP